MGWNGAGIRRKVQTLKWMKDLASAAIDPDRPLLAQIVVSRRCNLSCGYCYEYDHHSPPVPTADLLQRFDDLARLRVVFVTLNGGEPLMHPEVVQLVAAIRDRGMTPLMNSNGLLLNRERIEALGRAGLVGVQISCDGVEDNGVTQKTLRRVLPKLELLAEHATFRVRVNTVLGSGPPAEAVEVARVALALGLDTQCSLVRDAQGHALPLDAEAQEAYQTIRAMRGRLPAVLHDNFQLPLSRGEEVEWKCRSGARYFHVDEHGLVHLCQPRAGLPGKPLADYGVQDIRTYFNREKPCSARCPHAYAHIGSRMDSWRPQGGGCS